MSTPSSAGRKLLFNWRGVGWCEGTITSQNELKKNKIAGDVINFYVHYPVDDNESGHVLEIQNYAGSDEVRSADVDHMLAALLLRGPYHDSIQ